MAVGVVAVGGVCCAAARDCHRGHPLRDQVVEARHIFGLGSLDALLGFVDTSAKYVPQGGSGLLSAPDRSRKVASSKRLGLEARRALGAWGTASAGGAPQLNGRRIAGAFRSRAHRRRGDGPGGEQVGWLLATLARLGATAAKASRLAHPRSGLAHPGSAPDELVSVRVDRLLLHQSLVDEFAYARSPCVELIGWLGRRSTNRLAWPSINQRRSQGVSEATSACGGCSSRSVSMTRR